MNNKYIQLINQLNQWYHIEKEDLIDLNLYLDSHKRNIENRLEKINNEGIRTCCTCGGEMDCGYIYNSNTYHEDCLPISIEQWNEEYEDDGGNCYKEWDSIYLED